MFDQILTLDSSVSKYILSRKKQRGTLCRNEGRRKVNKGPRWMTTRGFGGGFSLQPSRSLHNLVGGDGGANLYSYAVEVPVSGVQSLSGSSLFDVTTRNRVAANYKPAASQSTSSTARSQCGTLTHPFRRLVEGRQRPRQASGLGNHIGL